jgi:hypothetical protein
MVPSVAVHVTALLKAPVPFTVAVQVDVCEVLMEAGTATTEIPVTVDGEDVTPIFAEPEMLL